MILLDTSAAFALADSADERHADAIRLLEQIRSEKRVLFTHSYVLCEAFALAQRRLGTDAALDICARLRTLPLTVVDSDVHDRAITSLKSTKRRPTSLVDAVSFVVMEDRGVEMAFAFDDDFVKGGFRLFGSR